MERKGRVKNFKLELEDVLGYAKSLKSVKQKCGRHRESGYTK